MAASRSMSSQSRASRQAAVNPAAQFTAAVGVLVAAVFYVMNLEESVTVEMGGVSVPITISANGIAMESDSWILWLLLNADHVARMCHLFLGACVALLFLAAGLVIDGEAGERHPYRQYCLGTATVLLILAIAIVFGGAAMIRALVRNWFGVSGAAASSAMSDLVSSTS